MELTGTSILQIALGIVLLLLGRHLWLIAAVAGFVLGFSAISLIVPDPSIETQLIAGAAVGGLGIVLVGGAKGLTKIAAGIAGALAGGSAVLSVLNMLAVAEGPAYWIAMVVGGVLGLIFASQLVDLVIVLLSSIIGAALVADGLQNYIALDSLGVIVLAVVLAVIGILIQSRARR